MWGTVISGDDKYLCNFGKHLIRLRVVHEDDALKIQDWKTSEDVAKEKHQNNIKAA